jgi:hypothetical protein
MGKAKAELQCFLKEYYNHIKRCGDQFKDRGCQIKNCERKIMRFQCRIIICVE